MSELEFRDVTVKFGTGRSAFTAVQNVSLTVPSGTVLGLVGESGSGKSTLARAAVGLTEPTSGRILLDGVDLVRARGESDRLRKRIQMVFQDPYSCLDPRLTIGESIEEAIRVSSRRSKGVRRPAASRKDEVARMLSLVGLDDNHAAASPAGLSGGQRQRVALARALAATPTVLLADEITSALDVSVQGSVLNLIATLQKERGLTMLFISHNLAVVRHVCDRIAVMYRGQLVEVGETLQLLEAPSSEYTRSLIASVPEVGRPLFDRSASGVAQ